MQAPNLISVVIVVTVIAALQALNEQLPQLNEPWVPFVVIAATAIIKMLQVYMQGDGGAVRAARRSVSFWGRVLRG